MSAMPMEVIEPIDYEKFVHENKEILETNSQKDMLVFPEEDVTVTTLARTFRTVEIPVPGTAK